MSEFNEHPSHPQDTVTDQQLSRRGLLKLMSLATVAPAATATLTGCGHADAAEAPVPTVTIGATPYKVALCHKLLSTSYQLGEAVDNFIAYMKEAKANGAAIVAGGELYLPGYPNDINYTPDWATRGWPSYKTNSMTVGDNNWNRLLEAARTIGIAVCTGFSEKAGNLYYMSHVLIGPDGTVWNLRRKVRPSGSERNFWSDDVMKGNLNVVTTPLGRISMLDCWDHLRPQSTYAVMAQLPNLHFCAWPITSETTPNTPWWDRQEVAHTAASYFSQLTGAVTLLVSYGYCAVYIRSVKVAELLPGDAANMLYHTIDPTGWTGQTSDPTSEFSWGVLGLMTDGYPAARVPDPEHGVLKLNPQ